MKKNYFISVVLLFSFLATQAQSYHLMSPDRNIVVTIVVGSDVHYSLAVKNQKVLLDSPLSVNIEQAAPLGNDILVEKEEQTAIQENWTPILGKHKRVENHCNELVLHLRERHYPLRSYSIIFRAYNDGIAFRYYFPKQNAQSDLKIIDENSCFHFADNYKTWMADYKNIATSAQESEFFPSKLSDITEKTVCGLPLLLQVADSLYLALTEANLYNWAGMYVGLANNDLCPGIMLKTCLSYSSKNNVRVVVSPPVYSPWRVLMIASQPGKLIESELIANLSDPNKLKDTSWIKPGMCAWDNWWSNDVKMDTETEKKYIQFASEMGFPYQLVDWQWYGAFNTSDADVMRTNSMINMPELLRFAKEKNVRLWLWLYYKDIDKQMDEAFALYEKWGIAGVKIDFMDSQTQSTVDWYERTVQCAAKHHLMVNFHGAYKPTGMERTYPNMMTREGVLGNEYNQWSLRVTPEHNVTIPFTRMVAGPMDYTPGGFLNRTPEDFRCSFPTQVMTTRCQQLAMFVVYYSPIATVCDHPDNYKGQLGADFLKIVPTTSDDIKVVNGLPGQYITVAKRKGNDWFIGSMNNSEERELLLNFSFLDEGKYQATIWEDADDANVNANHLVKRQMKVASRDIIKYKMSNGGGFVVYLKKL